MFGQNKHFFPLFSIFDNMILSLIENQIFVQNFPNNFNLFLSILDIRKIKIKKTNCPQGTINEPIN